MMILKNKLIALICSVSLLTACNSNTQKTDLPVAEFEKAIGQENIQVLDVRTPGEYETGHLKNALLADWNNQAEFTERAKGLDKSKTVYTYCLSGARSGAATDWLRENGFTAYNLEGGINAWRNADKPLEQAKEVRQITMAEYLEQIPTDKTVLVDFSATWCAPCKMMAPVLDTLVARYPAKFVLVKIDGGEQSAICKELNIEGFPTFIIYKQGRVTWRKQGLVEMKDFVEQL
ncbi:MAG: thioredoxin domain-containing protein [Ferruginibacter sp.]